MAVRLCIITMLALACVEEVGATEVEMHKNPIRKVVTMLQDMQKSIVVEGEKEEELFDKFMCYCKSGKDELTASIEGSKASVEQLTGKIESDTALKSQLEQDVIQHKADREAAEAAIKESTAMRKKEASEFAATSGEMKGNVEAMGGALAALKKGLSAALIQTDVGQLLRNVVAQSPAISAGKRELLTSLLQSGSDEEAGGTDQIVGIVQQMKETMESDLKETIATEEEAKESFATLMDSKNKEIAAAGKAVEEKTARVGQVAVEAVQAQSDLEATQDALAEDSELKANLAKSCATKQQEWDARSKLRAEEIQAVSETIEMLNGDDAMELFKKTTASAGAASFLQTAMTSQSKLRRARTLLRNIEGTGPHAVQIRMLLLSLKSQSGGKFDKVVAMIDDMVALLGKEQKDDDAKKDFCVAELDKADDEKKALAGSIADLAAAIEEMADAIATTSSEVATLKKGLQDLDMMVASATDMRKDEHAEFTATSAANQAAVELIGMAKNRMNKFYAPDQYKAPPTTASPALIEYRKSEASGGVIGMMSAMIKEIENDMAEAKRDEAQAQADYEEAMKDAALKREEDSKLLVTKDGEKAEMTSKSEDLKEQSRTKTGLLTNTNAALNDLHRTCDLLLDNYDSRKEARTKESEGLTQSKSVLAGAKFGFLQRD